MKTNTLFAGAICVTMLVLGGCDRSEGAKPPTSTPPASTSTPPPPPVPVHDPDIERELMIRDLSVVNDARTQGPNGAWSFGKLIQGLAGSSDPAVVSKFVVSWLRSWDADQTVNTFTVPKRTKIRALIIDPWKAKDGQAGVADDAWKPNLANAPFRLLAIVNRMDLNRGSGAAVQNAGEGRFVFGVVRPDGSPAQFTVIFEYELLAQDRERLRRWAQEWHALGTIPFGTQYNAALQKITDQFAGAGAAPLKPNKSALNQLRTNEIELVLPPENVSRGWELREFNIGSDGLLHPVTTKQTPANAFQNKADLATFINDNAVALLDRTLFIPEKLPDGRAFLAGASVVAPPTQGFFWNAPGIQNNEARHQLGMLTCNGCHHRESNTTDFLHVKVRAADQRAELSDFLEGGPQFQDPVDPTLKRDAVNDLQARATILKALAGEIALPAGVLEGLEENRAVRVH